MAKKKAEKPTENASSEHPGTQNLVPVRTKEEARERGRKGGLKSAEVRRQKKTMRDMAKSIMETTVSEQMGNVRDTLARMGLEENDMTYQAAVVVRLIQKAMVEGDTSAIRVLGELTGELNRFGYIEADDPDVIELQYPAILIPENGRDEPKQNVLGPQAGPQTMFMASSADIVIYGGAAGGGKTYALLLEALRHKDVKGFGAVIFRKNFTQITAEGGLWDASTKIFSQVPDAHQRKTPKLHWKFDAGAKLTFAHLDREEDLLAWQGTEIAYLAFDELTHFTKHQFLYMLSRNRSTCGVKPYVRATCNPDSDSWVADFISWWIDQDTGYPIRERSGVVRYMCVLNDVIYWGDSPEDLAENSKAQLHEWRWTIDTFLEKELELSLNQKTCIRPINQGIEFVGYRLWYNKVVLRKSTTLGMKRSLRGVANKYHDYEMTLEQVTQTFNSYTGMLEHTDSEELLASLYTDMILTHGERRENEERFIQMLPQEEEMLYGI